MHNDAAIMNKSGERQIPEIVTFYNSTKGGVDCMDLMAQSNVYQETKKKVADGQFL